MAVQAFRNFIARGELVGVVVLSVIGVALIVLAPARKVAPPTRPPTSRIVRPEDQLAASGKIAITDRLPHEFAFTINNILSVIEGYSELASEGLLPDDPRSRHLEEIKKACRRASSLARQELALNG